MFTEEKLEDLQDTIVNYLKEKVVSDVGNIVEYLISNGHLQRTRDIPYPKEFVNDVLNDLVSRMRLLFIEEKGIYSPPKAWHKSNLDRIKDGLQKFLFGQQRLGLSVRIAEEVFFDKAECKYGRKLTENLCIRENTWKEWLRNSVIGSSLYTDNFEERQTVVVPESTTTGIIEPIPPRLPFRYVLLWVAGIVIGIISSIVGILTDLFGLVNIRCLPIIKEFTNCTEVLF